MQFAAERYNFDVMSARQRGDPDDLRSRAVTIRVTPRELLRFKGAADKQFLELGSWCRRELNLASQRELLDSSDDGRNGSE